MKLLDENKKVTAILHEQLFTESKSEPLMLGPLANGVIHVAADIDSQDKIDPGKEIVLELWVSDDGINFRLDAACSYKGGVYKNQDAPGFLCDADQYRGKTLEVRIRSPKGETKSGATIEHKPDTKIKGFVEI
jgi:hypothetical protein